MPRATSAITGDRMNSETAETATSRPRLARPSSAALAEAFGEHEPARTQVLHGDLAGVLRVDRREVVEAHPVVQLHVEQLVHRDLAARVGEADDHAIDAAVADDGRDVVGVAEDDAVEGGIVRLGARHFDEAGELDAELVPALVDLARQFGRRGAGADDQHPLVRAHPRRQPLERDAPAGDEQDDEQRADQEDAAADHQAGQPVVDHRQQGAAGAERLEQPDHQPPAIVQPARVIEVAIVQAGLEDAGNQDGAPDQGPAKQLMGGPHAHGDREDHGSEDQDVVHQDQRRSSPREPPEQRLHA